jgi:hypothetical protein
VDKQLPSYETVRPWVEAAGHLWIYRHLINYPGDSEGLIFRLATIARTQYGAELAYNRLLASAFRDDEPVERRIQLTLGQAADVHAFLGSGALYWSTLGETVRQVTRPDLRPAFERYTGAANTAKTARDHMEHLHERIRQGRTARWGEAMSVETFRTAVGAFDGSEIGFGNEKFRIGEMLQAIRDSATAIAPVLQQAASPKFEPRVDSPLASPD